MRVRGLRDTESETETYRDRQIDGEVHSDDQMSFPSLRRCSLSASLSRWSTLSVYYPRQTKREQRCTERRKDGNRGGKKEEGNKKEDRKGEKMERQSGDRKDERNKRRRKGNRGERKEYKIK